MFNQTFFVFVFHVKIKNKNIKKDKNKKGNILSGSVIELLLTLLGISGSLSRQSFGMKDILKKGRLQKKFPSRKCLHLKKVHSIKVTLILQSAHIQWNYLAVESVANRSSHSEVFREIGVPKFEIKIHEKYLWRSSSSVKLLAKSMQLY